MINPVRDRREREAELLQNLRAAADEFANAKCEHRKLLEISKDLGALHPDGSAALRQAMQVYNEKLSAYRMALKAFTDFTLRGVDSGAQPLNSLR